MTLSTNQDYAAREYLRDLRDDMREQNDGDKSVYTPRITFEVAELSE